MQGIPHFCLERSGINDDYDANLYGAIHAVEDGHFWFEARNQLIAQMIRNYFPAARSLLDVGCGTGFVLRHLRNEFSKLSFVGAEIYSTGLSQASRRMPDATFVQCDLRKLPFVGSFDVIGAFDVIEHIEEDDRVLGEMRKALTPGGGLILTVPQHPFLWSSHDVQDKHKRRYTRAELVNKVRAAGFEVQYVGSFVTLLLPLMLARKLQKLRASESATGRFQINSVVNRVLSGFMGLEVALIDRLKISLPFGGSLVLVAKRSS